MGIFTLGKTIYYPGSTLTKYCPEIVLNYKSLLSDFGMTFRLVENINTGWALWNQGYQKEFEAHRIRLAKWFAKNNIKTVITSSPEAHFMLTHFYPEVESHHTTKIIHEHRQKIVSFNTGTACFHDNTTQVRRNGFIQEARDILHAAGFDLEEFRENRQETQCLGSSTGLLNNSPRLAAKLAMRRARMAPAKIIITDSPEDYVHLKRNTSATVMELSEVLVEI